MRAHWLDRGVLIVVALLMMAAVGGAERQPLLAVAVDNGASLKAGQSGPEAVWPGPDGFGYSGQATTYEWLEISTTGTAIAGLTDDGYLGPFPIGFNFSFYGTAYSDFYVASNGYISFGAGSSTLTNQCPLPNTTTPNNIIALMWDDLDPGDTGDLVYYQTFGTCPIGSGACLVVQYDDFCHYPGGTSCAIAGTWEAILFASSGNVIIQYEDAGAEEGSGSTEGIEGNNAAADWGLTYACNLAASVTDGAAIEFVCGPCGTDQNINVTPLSLASTQVQNTTTSQTLDIGNTGDQALTWAILEEPDVVVVSGGGGSAPRPPATGAVGARGYTPDATPPIAYESPEDFAEGFEDITLLPGQGWFFQNNSSPLGLTDWFQGNDTVFPAHAGTPTSYIGANFNNTSGVGTISNWMLTPQIALADGDTIAFWTRTATGSVYPDRLEVRLSTAGSSTNVGTLATDVGDFTTLLLTVNPSLAVGGYPEVWTQFTVTLSGIPGGATGRVGFRYYVTDAGPSGSNSDYIGIDTFEYASGAPSLCQSPADVPWLSTAPSNGTTAGGASTPVQVSFDSTGLAVGTYNANLCVTSNDPDPGPGNGTDLVVVPVELNVAAGTNPAISLNKTVGTTPGVCATTSTITVVGRHDGLLLLRGDEHRRRNLHDFTTLSDNQLGTIFTGLNYSLAPGATSTRCRPA